MLHHQGYSEVKRYVPPRSEGCVAVKNTVSTSTVSTALPCANVYLYCSCYIHENTKTKKKASNILVLSWNPKKSTGQVSTDHRTTDIEHTGTPKTCSSTPPIIIHQPVISYPHYLLLQVTFVPTATIND